jgi:5-bromo-4-chloroindolyl phosphate hydrolysis protein
MNDTVILFSSFHAVIKVQIISVAVKYYKGDQVKKDEMGKAYDMCRRDQKYIQNCGRETLREM